MVGLGEHSTLSESCNAKSFRSHEDGPHCLMMPAWVSYRFAVGVISWVRKRVGPVIRQLASLPLVLRACALALPALLCAVPVNPSDESEEGYFEPYLALIEEVDLRRRVNVLHPNPQSMFDGLQVGFVNVGSGNLTFLRRDLVVDGDVPLVFGRVHDSRIARNADFGPRWRLSLAEELRIDDSGAEYVDRAGAVHRFKKEGDDYSPSPVTPRHSGTTLEVDGDTARLVEASGTVRNFERHSVSQSL